MDEAGHEAALRVLDRLWSELDIVEVDDDVVRRAARLAHACALRGHDAVRCAAAERLDDDDVVIASGDRKLPEACAALGMATADTSVP